MRAVIPIFGLDAIARAYFFGEVQPLRAAMEARWGANNWRGVAGHATGQNQKRALALIRQLEDAYQKRLEAEEALRKRLEEQIRTSPRGDFPTPTRARTLAGLGDPQPAETPLTKKTSPFLVFSRISPFAVDKSVLTPALKQQVTRVADYVRSRLNTAQPIGVIRVVGHTDARGEKRHNVDLGNRRMEAVKAELQVQLRDVLHRVLIESDDSPGKSQPIGDNSTATGQAANRRVDVYIAPPIPPAPPWPQGKKYDWTVRDPNPDKDPFRIVRGIPPPLGGKTVRQFLTDLCRGRFTKDTCKTIVGKALDFGCKGAESLAVRLGATLTDADKEEMQRQCKAAADKAL
jgi:outer membrane protein OmpA-like peptidoglycan-associated protein